MHRPSALHVRHVEASNRASSRCLRVEDRTSFGFAFLILAAPRGGASDELKIGCAAELRLFALLSSRCSCFAQHSTSFLALLPAALLCAARPQLRGALSAASCATKTPLLAYSGLLQVLFTSFTSTSAAASSQSALSTGLELSRPSLSHRRVSCGFGA